MNVLVDLPDNIARTAEQEARRTGRSLGELIVDLLRGAFGLPNEERTGGAAPGGAGQPDDSAELLALVDRSKGSLDEEAAMMYAVSEVRTYRKEKGDNS